MFNDMYAKDISKKIKSVKRDKQKKGQFIGGKPMFGYKMHPTEKNKIVIDEQAAIIVKKIFAMASIGYSCRKIASILNEEKIPTPAAYAGLTISNKSPYSGMWSSNRVSEMLRNETYIGNMVQGRSVKVNYKSKKCLRQKPENWIVVKNTHEPLVDIETFEKIQLMLASRKTTRSRTYDFLLKGLIYCHECGYPMSVINRKNTSGEDVLYFICRTYQRFTKANVCTCHSIKESKITMVVQENVLKLCKEQIQKEKMIKLAENVLNNSSNKQTIKNEIKIFNEKIERLTSNIDKIYDDRLNEIISDEDFQRIYQSTLKKRNECIEKVKLLESRNIDEIKTKDKVEKLLKEFIENIPTNRELLVSLIDRIEFTENKEVIIKFKCSNLK